MVNEFIAGENGPIFQDCVEDLEDEQEIVDKFVYIQLELCFDDDSLRDYTHITPGSYVLNDSLRDYTYITPGSYVFCLF